MRIDLIHFQTQKNSSQGISRLEKIVTDNYSLTIVNIVKKVLRTQHSNHLIHVDSENVEEGNFIFKPIADWQ